jgi:hypothetical protein
MAKSPSSSSGKVFQERLWSLVKQGVAWRYVGVGSNFGKIYTIVSHGPLTGTWIFNKVNQRLTYQFKLPPIQNLYTKANGKLVSLALPSFVYEGKDSHHHVLHKKYKNHLAWASVNWKRFRDQQIIPLSDLSKLVAEKVSFPPSLDGQLRCIAGLAWPVLCHEAITNPEKLKFKLEWLQRHNTLVESLGSKKRQRFLIRLLKLGPKKALRASFPKTHRMAINELVNYQAYIYKHPYAPAISQIRGEIHLHNVMLAWELLKGFPEFKKEILAYAYSYRLSPNYNGVNLNRCPWYHLRIYIQESNRLKEMEVANPFPDFPPTMECAIRWHHELTQILRDHLKAISQIQITNSEKLHTEHWKNFRLNSNITPLITYKDFQQESIKMHHCIDTHFGNTSCIYGRVKYKNEKANFQINIKNGHIYQLYGPCNQEVSLDMRNLVQSWACDNKT